MTCDEVSRNDIVERYLLGELDEDVRDAFEAHYFECARCFGLLQTYRELRAELARTRREHATAAASRGWIWQWAWVPAVAVVLIAVSVTLWERPRPDGDSPLAANPPQAPSSEPGGEPVTPPPNSPTLAELARVEPPRYARLRVRGAGDAATAKFQSAMEQYQRAEYAAASIGLSEAAALDPEAPHILFFLGASRLMSGELDRAVDALGKTIAVGDSPYLDEALFLRAKTFLRQERIEAASADLRRCVQLSGDWAPEASRLLTQIEALTRPPA